MKKCQSLLIIFIIIVLFVSCENNKCVEGSGKIMGSNIDATGFTGIYSDGDFDIVVEQNDSNYYEIYIEADKEFMPQIEAVQTGSDITFRVLNDKCFRGERPRIYVYTPELYYVNNSASGSITCYDVYNDHILVENEASGDIYFENLDTYETGVHNSGSGKIQLRGNTLYGEYLNSGSGLIYARDLIHQNADVEISGSGDVYIFVVNDLYVKISGSGDLFYRGSPDIVTNVTGTGSVYDANN